MIEAFTRELVTFWKAVNQTLTRHFVTFCKVVHQALTCHFLIFWMVVIQALTCHFVTFWKVVNQALICHFVTFWKVVNQAFTCHFVTFKGQDRSVGRAPDSWSRVSNSGRGGGRTLFSTVNFLCWLVRCPIHPRVTTVARKKVYTLDPTKSEWADYVFKALCEKNIKSRKRAHTQLVRKSSATAEQLSEPPWTNPGLNSGIGVHELIST